MLDRIVDQIIVHLRKKEAVNVNCAAGISHSGLVCTAVLMKYLELDSATAHAKVAEQRGALEDEEHLARLRESRALPRPPRHRPEDGTLMGAPQTSRSRPTWRSCSPRCPRPSSW